VRIALRDWLMPLGAMDRLGACLEEAETISRRLSDRRRVGLVVGHRAHYHWTVGEHERALHEARHAAAIAERLDDFTLRVLSNFYLGEVHHALGITTPRSTRSGGTSGW